MQAYMSKLELPSSIYEKIKKPTINLEEKCKLLFESVGGKTFYSNTWNIDIIHFSPPFY